MILPKAGDWMSISCKRRWLLVHDLDYEFGKIPPVGGMAISPTIRNPHIALLCTELNERGGFCVSPLESGLHSTLGPCWPSVFPFGTASPHVPEIWSGPLCTFLCDRVEHGWS